MTSMQLMNDLRRIDLNLLVIFEALVEERSVGKAAARLGITSSAVSHALRRLRTQFNDPLLLRTAEGMSPTPEAVRLASDWLPLTNAVELVRPLFMDQWPQQPLRHAVVLAATTVVAFWLALALTRRRFRG